MLKAKVINQIVQWLNTDHICVSALSEVNFTYPGKSLSIATTYRRMGLRCTKQIMDYLVFIGTFTAHLVIFCVASEAVEETSL